MKHGQQRGCSCSGSFRKLRRRPRYLHTAIHAILKVVKLLCVAVEQACYMLVMLNLKG